jgi:hypothetical protein
LTVPLLVRGTFFSEMTMMLLVLSGGGCMFTGLGIYFAIDGGPVDFVIGSLLLGLALGPPAIVGLVRKMNQRRWLEVTLPGFVLSGRGKKIAVTDDQVIAVSRWSKIDDIGITNRVVRLEMDIRGTVETIECRYRLRVTQIDPLAVFVERLDRSLARRTREGLSRGAALSGKGWRVDRDGLRCVVGGKPGCYPMHCLSHVSQDTAHLCTWKGDEDEPFLRIPLKSRNAYPLGLLLQEAIRANPSRTEKPPSNPLGRMLLKCHYPDRGKGLIFAGGMLAVALFFGAIGLTSGDSGLQFRTYLAAVLGLCNVPVGILLFLWSSRPTVLFHEAGISQPDRVGTLQLLYTDVGTMTWKGGKEITFTPRAGSDGSVIHYRSAHGRETTGLNAQRDRVAAIIAQRWLADLEKGPVTWTPRLRFQSNGMEYRPERKNESDHSRVVPYEILHHRFERGQLLLFVNGEPEILAKEQLSAVNIFPGMMLLSMIWERYKTSAPGADLRSLDPPQETVQSSPPEDTWVSSEVRITASGGSNRAVTTDIPDAGHPGEDEE